MARLQTERQASRRVGSVLQSTIPDVLSWVVPRGRFELPRPCGQPISSPGLGVPRGPHCPECVLSQPVVGPSKGDESEPSLLPLLLPAPGRPVRLPSSEAPDTEERRSFE